MRALLDLAAIVAGLLCVLYGFAALIVATH